MTAADRGPGQKSIRLMLAVYVLPYVLYLGLTQVPAALPGLSYPACYTAVVLLVGAVTVSLLWARPVLRPHGRVLAAVAVGLVGFVLWVGLSGLHLEERLTASWPGWLRPQARRAFNPYDEIGDPLARWAFVAVRLEGLALLVPVVEELFVRGFLARWLVSADWQRQEVGRFTPFSFAAVTLFFTLTHPEWLAAAAYCCLLNGLLAWKRDLWDCVVAHAVSNLALGGYVLAARAWELW